MRSFLVIAFLILTTPLSAATNTTESIYSTVPKAVSKKPARQTRPQCEATTLSGNRCKRHATQGSRYCSQHAAIIRRREKE